MKYKNIIKTILVIVLIIIWLIVADYVLNKTHTEISLPLGMILLNLPIFIIGICLIIYFKKKLNKKKNVTIGDNLCMAFICLIVSFYFIIKVFPFFLDTFGKVEEVNLINAEIYTLRNFEMHGPDYQYFIKGYDAKKGNISIRIRVEDYAKKIKEDIKKDKFTKVYYYKHSNYVYKIITDE